MVRSSVNRYLRTADFNRCEPERCFPADIIRLTTWVVKLAGNLLKTLRLILNSQFYATLYSGM